MDQYDFDRIIDDLDKRVNVNVLTTDDNKKIIIYDDHRWILNVLFKLFKGGIHRPNLVTFDSHDDAVDAEPLSQILKMLEVEDLSDATEKMFSAFVDYDLSPLDDDWLTIACELNLIGDACVIGNRNNDNIERRGGIYTSEDGTKHNQFELNRNIESEIGIRGKLGDSARDKEFAEIRDFFKSGNLRYNAIGEMSPFVLDFDLDFFTIDPIDDNPILAWPSKIWRKHFEKFNPTRMFYQTLINKSSLITICREPDCCGGYGESNKILEMLDFYLFNGQLNACNPY